MNKRRPIQEGHEYFLIAEFIKWWETQTGEKFNVISRPHPDPPEAIVKSKKRTTWIEVTDAFYSDEWARDQYSYATPEEKHMRMKPGPHEGMDAQTAKHFITILKKKLSKKSYAKPYDQHGPGILLIGIQSPWFDDQTCSKMNEECEKAEWSADQGYFSHVYISYSSLNQQSFEKWKWNI